MEKRNLNIPFSPLFVTCHIELCEKGRGWGIKAGTCRDMDGEKFHGGNSKQLNLHTH